VRTVARERAAPFPPRTVAPKRGRDLLYVHKKKEKHRKLGKRGVAWNSLCPS